MNVRVAEEAQLLAEERWIIDALTKIKHQRNCLQIERLHLESLKAKQNQKSHGKEVEKPTDSITSSSKICLNDVTTTRPATNDQNSMDFDTPLVGAETACNEEQLNLVVTKSIYSQDYISDNMEEYDDEDDAENVLIDINMLMNSTME